MRTALQPTSFSWVIVHGSQTEVPAVPPLALPSETMLCLQGTRFAHVSPHPWDRCGFGLDRLTTTSQGSPPSPMNLCRQDSDRIATG